MFDINKVNYRIELDKNSKLVDFFILSVNIFNFILYRGSFKSFVQAGIYLHIFKQTRSLTFISKKQI